MKHLLPLLLLFACGPGAGTGKVYRQSAMPMAPTFSPVEDAPHTTGQPGYVGEPERLPRGTDRRVLPQTPETRREAGVWASSGQSDASLRIFGHLLPLQKDDDVAVAAVGGMCAVTMNEALHDAGLMDLALALDDAHRQCVAATLYHSCITTMLRKEEAARSNGTAFDAAKLEAHRKAYRDAVAFIGRACTDEVLKNQDAARISTQAIRYWMKGHH